MHWPKAALRTGSLLLRPSIHGCWNETLLSSCSLYDVHYNWYLTIYMPLASVVDNTFCAVRCRSDLSRGLLSYEENLHGGERMFNIERCSTVMILPACHAGLTQFSVCLFNKNCCHMQAIYFWCSLQSDRPTWTERIIFRALTWHDRALSLLKYLRPDLKRRILRFS